MLIEAELSEVLLDSAAKAAVSSGPVGLSCEVGVGELTVTFPLDKESSSGNINSYCYYLLFLLVFQSRIEMDNNSVAAI